jgi:hypothetical protein
MGLDELIIALGIGFLGFVLGLAIGYEDAIKRCRRAFKNEGYNYSEFQDVLDGEK